MTEEQKAIVIPHLDPPKAFSFKTEDWNRWAQRWERYRHAAGLAQRSQEDQVNILIYTMCDRADDIILSFKLSDEEQKRYDTVMGKFKTHFGEKTNVIYERARFNQRRQDANETVDEFIADLFRLAESCNFGNLREELIRDRIVVGVRNTKLSEAMQLQSDLTLEKAISKTRQADEVKRHQNLVRGEQTSVTSGLAIDHIRRQKSNQQSKTSGKHGEQRSNKKAQKCNRCGCAPQHAFIACPAKHSDCNNCGKRGHWEAVCNTKKKKVHEINKNKPGEGANMSSSYSAADAVFADQIEVNSAVTNTTPAWKTTVKINKIPIDFKIDTGADVSIIGEELRRQQFSKIAMSRNKEQSGLRAVGNLSIPVKGSMQVNIEWQGQKCQERIYVVPGAREPLLSRTAIERLGIIRWVNSAREQPEVRYKKVFKGLGRLNRPYTLRLKEDATPYAVSTSRRVAIPLREKVRQALQTMQKEDIISPVDEPTEWCAGMVIVPKPNGDVRICVDYTHLNKSVQREKHILPAVDETLASLAGAKVFSKLDACSGYYQIMLQEKSRKLTTFITPFGRFYFNRLPMGVSSSGEHFQKQMSAILEGIEGACNLMDDTLVYGATEAEQDRRLEIVLKRLQDNGVTLNKAKCIFRTSSVKFLGHVISAEKGVQPDPDKVRAVKDMERPKSREELRRFLGMVHYHTKFLNHLADAIQPFRDLLKKNHEFVWTAVHKQAFDRIKESLAKAPALAFYDPSRKTRISADSSSYGLGAILEQDMGSQWQPVSYASRGLTATEKRYAQIEKEALALTWACEKFADYIIAGSQGWLLLGSLALKAGGVPGGVCGDGGCRCASGDVSQSSRVVCVPAVCFSGVTGGDGDTAAGGVVASDTLSRVPLQDKTSEEDILLDEGMNLFVQTIEEATPVGDKLLKEVIEAQNRDVTSNILRQYTREGWPTHKSSVKIEARKFFEHRGNLSELKEILAYGTRLYIPEGPLRKQMLERVHTGHLGITQCTDRAKEAIWWPGISTDIKNQISQCKQCLEHRPQVVEPLLPTQTPERPWYFEMAELRSTSSSAVIEVAKKIFARFGVPETMRADNGPQYREEFRQFANEWHFRLITSSPYHPRSNGQVEAAVKIAKALLLKEKEVEQGLLVYRATPLESGVSPAELLMGRKLRSNIPQHRQKMHDKRIKIKHIYDQRHRTHKLKELEAGQKVWITDRKTYGRVLRRREEPRSYEVETPTGTIRRNRAFLVPVQGDIEDSSYDQFISEPEQGNQSGSAVEKTVEVTAKGASRTDSQSREQDNREPSTPRRSNRVRKSPDRFDPSKYPLAIAAPTPVSALVHSSTLVTTGVYLIIRFNKFLVTTNIRIVLGFLSILTIFISGIIANFENDLKKIIALSTLRQLGIIMIILRFGYRLVAYYHLLIHAIFKSMLFIGAGRVIHIIKNTQDIRLLGNLNEGIPYVIIRLMISNFALGRVPFISGFYRKDLIIDIFYVHSGINII
ncbi:PREDICTED: uncharacterized protein LOC108765221, partial [Trachymyrmex cornetzi]|uniref:uncharacterized protein LOC108765221 n=1 Tax=Trachymyrmex cornetzi TaxID=471704 RepID=UPI00084EE22C